MHSSDYESTWLIIWIKKVAALFVEECAQNRDELYIEFHADDWRTNLIDRRQIMKWLVIISRRSFTQSALKVSHKADSTLSFKFFNNTTTKDNTAIVLAYMNSSENWLVAQRKSLESWKQQSTISSTLDSSRYCNVNRSITFLQHSIFSISILELKTCWLWSC